MIRFLNYILPYFVIPYRKIIDKFWFMGNILLRAFKYQVF